ncbi:MAG TPA: LamG-like jellyroll fold domain-containing protein [Verrucomicrobiales bacterium]|nr:LamG-like jellyroll fold domain-containing protein [Verrucomicrobiales bacterium]
MLAFAALTGLSSATVTPYCWIRGGEAGLMTDSSGLNHNFNAAFSSLGGGNPAAIVVPNGAGGPLGPTTAVSTASIRWGSFGVPNAGMWIQGPNNSVPTPDLWSLPATNWAMEAWVLPVGTGASGGGASSQIVSTGSGQFGGMAGGAAFKLNNNFDGTYTITAVDIGQSNLPIGDPVITDGGTWLHLAVVNVDGTDTFYVNGVAHGLPLEGASAPGGVPYIGSGQDTGGPFDGYLDEIRYSTFAAGAFQVSDLFARPQGPNIITQPESASVWTGGPAVFEVQAVYDAATTYQWKLGGTAIPGAPSLPEYYLPGVTAADNSKVFSVAVKSHAIEVPGSNATLTVVPVETANVAYYRAAVQAEASLLAYFPMDGDTGASLTNTKDGTHNAAATAGASFDGRTTRSYGERALRLKGDGEATIPANPSFEFTPAGGGTIEAVVFLAKGGGPGNETLFSVAGGSVSSYYQIQTTPTGNALLFKSDTMTQALSWPVTPPLLGRRAHVAVVFGADATITVYVDGQSLGSKANPGFGLATGMPANIGSCGNLEAPWFGTIDELAVYGSALSANTVAVHNSRFVFGTAVSPPVIQSQPTGTKNLLIGGAPVFSVKATGTAPLTYQWKLNNNPITGNSSATTPTLTLNNATAAMSGTYTVTVTNDVNHADSTPFTVNFTAPGDTYSAKVMADNPSAYWRLNETTGIVLKDYAGALDGTYSTTVDRGVTPADGFTDLAAHFSGTGSPVPNATVPYSPTLNPGTDFTIEFWVKPDLSDQRSIAVLASQDRSVSRAGFAVYQGLNGAFWEVHFGNPTAAMVTAVGGTTSPQAGVWYHVAATWDSAANTGHIFVNGVEEGAAAGDAIVVNPAVAFEIGSRFNGGVPYKGAIDEVTFYNHLLAPDRISAHAQSLPPAAASLDAPVYANGMVTLTWTGPATLILQESTDLNTWTTVQGAVSGYSTSASGKKYYRLAQP